MAEGSSNKEVHLLATDRRVGAAVDFSGGSKAAIRWAGDHLLRHGDNLICLVVMKDAHYEGGETQLWEATGSPLVPLSDFCDPVVQKKYGVKADPETLEILRTLAIEKEVYVVVKIYWGDAREKICQAVNDIPLSCIVIGSRGLGKIKRVLLGSVSEYVVNNAACPVTVVKGTDRDL